MKEWAADRINPELAKERADRQARKSQKVSKKIKLAAMANLHGIQLKDIVQ